MLLSIIKSKKLPDVISRATKTQLQNHSYDSTAMLWWLNTKWQSDA